MSTPKFSEERLMQIQQSLIDQLLETRLGDQGRRVGFVIDDESQRAAQRHGHGHV